MAHLMMVASTGLKVMSALQEGGDADDAAKYRAKQLKRQANSERAVAQRKAIEARRAGQLKASRARALAGARPGAGFIDTLGEIEGDTDYDVANALFIGEDRARGLTDQAELAKFQGRQAKKASRTKAASELLGGSYSLYTKYGGK